MPKTISNVEKMGRNILRSLYLELVKDIVTNRLFFNWNFKYSLDGIGLNLQEIPLWGNNFVHL